MEVGDFYDDLNKSGGAEQLEAWEEQVGIRLYLRIIDQMCLEQSSRLEDQTQDIARLKEEKVAIQEENSKVRKELKKLTKAQAKVASSSESKLESKDAMESLLRENKSLKDQLSKSQAKSSAEPSPDSKKAIESLSKENKILKEKNLKVYF